MTEGVHIEYHNIKGNVTAELVNPNINPSVVAAYTMGLDETLGAFNERVNQAAADYVDGVEEVVDAPVEEPEKKRRFFG